MRFLDASTSLSMTFEHWVNIYITIVFCRVGITSSVCKRKDIYINCDEQNIFYRKCGMGCCRLRSLFVYSHLVKLNNIELWK